MNLWWKNQWSKALEIKACHPALNLHDFNLPG
jgi:hypothetical protein